MRLKSGWTKRIAGWLLTTSAAGALPLQQLDGWGRASKLESKTAYLQQAKACRRVCQAQGGSPQAPGNVPTLLLPDLHAQRDYLLAALHKRWRGGTVWTALQGGKINVVCLGDGMHAEGRARERWLQAEQDVLAGRPSPSMQAELTESLGLLRMVMALKVAYPRNFYFVRGNHEDIDPEIPYRKFTETGESVLVRTWVTARFGADFVKQWHACEQSFPLVVRGGSFIASHAAPDAPLTLAAVQTRSNAAFRACCWSDNTTWNGGNPTFLANCARWKVTPTRPWIVGHRKVTDARYRVQCGGRLVQINPLDDAPRVVILAPPAGSALQPERDVRWLKDPL